MVTKRGSCTMKREDKVEKKKERQIGDYGVLIHPSCIPETFCEPSAMEMCGKRETELMAC